MDQAVALSVLPFSLRCRGGNQVNLLYFLCGLRSTPSLCLYLLGFQSHPSSVSSLLNGIESEKPRMPQGQGVRPCPKHMLVSTTPGTLRSVLFPTKDAILGAVLTSIEVVVFIVVLNPTKLIFSHPPSLKFARERLCQSSGLLSQQHSGNGVPPSCRVGQCHKPMSNSVIMGALKSRSSH